MTQSIKDGQKTVARKTYNQLIETTTVLRIANPLFTDNEIGEKIDLVAQACIHEICRLMGWSEEYDFIIIFDALYDELTFDELLEKFSELDGEV